jgi:hypothetical protein
MDNQLTPNNSSAAYSVAVEIVVDDIWNNKLRRISR